MRIRVARLLIVLAFGLLVADLAWALRRLAPTLLRWAGGSPDAVLLAVALLLLIAAWGVRRGARSQPRQGAQDR